MSVSSKPDSDIKLPNNPMITLILQMMICNKNKNRLAKDRIWKKPSRQKRQLEFLLPKSSSLMLATYFISYEYRRKNKGANCQYDILNKDQGFRTSS